MNRSRETSTVNLNITQPPTSKDLFDAAVNTLSSQTTLVLMAVSTQEVPKPTEEEFSVTVHALTNDKEKGAVIITGTPKGKNIADTLASIIMFAYTGEGAQRPATANLIRGQAPSAA